MDLKKLTPKDKYKMFHRMYDIYTDLAIVNENILEEAPHGEVSTKTIKAAENCNQQIRVLCYLGDYLDDHRYEEEYEPVICA